MPGPGPGLKLPDPAPGGRKTVSVGSRVRRCQLLTYDDLRRLPAIDGRPGRHGQRTLRSHVAAVMSSSRNAKVRLLRRLNALAWLVQDYWSVFTVSRNLLDTNAPPVSVLVQARQLVRSGYKLLCAMHQKCPELDQYVFRGCDALFRRVRKNGTRSVCNRSVRKVQGRAEERKGGGVVVAPSGLRLEL